MKQCLSRFDSISTVMRHPYHDFGTLRDPHPPSYAPAPTICITRVPMCGCCSPDPELVSENIPSLAQQQIRHFCGWKTTYLSSTNLRVCNLRTKENSLSPWLIIFHIGPKGGDLRSAVLMGPLLAFRKGGFVWLSFARQDCLFQLGGGFDERRFASY